MALYLLQGAYTPESWSAMLKNPHDRGEAVRPVIEKLGGKIVHSWFAFGENDVVAVVDMPDSISAAAFSLAVAAAGGTKNFKTTPLLTMQEGIQAMKKAATCGYKPATVTAAARP